MEAFKKFADKTKLAAKIVNFKNADIYDIGVIENGRQFTFKQSDGWFKIPNDKNSNQKLAEGLAIEFNLNGDHYFSPNAKISKAEADKLQTALTAAVLDQAANSAVTSEKIKSTNIKKVGLIVTGSILLISGIAAIFYYSRKSSQGTI